MRIAMIGVKGIPLPSGIENVVQQVGMRLSKKGHDVTVYVRPHYTPKTRHEYCGMRLINLPSIRTKHLDAISHTMLATAHAMFSGVDIAHIHSIGLSPFALPLRVIGVPTVVQSHGLDWQRAKWGHLSKAYLRATDYTTTHFPDVTSVVSQKMKQYYEMTYKRPVVYIPNGVNLCSRVPPNEILKLGLRGNDYILFAARLVPEKGLHYLIEAYNQISKPGKKLVIAGDANYGDRYASEMKKHASDNIIFVGFATGRLLEELLSCAYLYVLPSEIEGLSTGLLEAMSYGNCVLTSDIEENREATADSGVCFRSADIEDLKSKIEFLLHREDVVRGYRVMAQRHVQRNFSWDKVADEFERVYTNLLERKHCLFSTAAK